MGRPRRGRSRSRLRHHFVPDSQLRRDREILYGERGVVVAGRLYLSVSIVS
jgi:hypothetical protein